MESKDPGSKKFNNEQEVNEGFSGDNLPENYNPSALKPETETDKSGHKTVVERARNVDAAERSWNENESLSRGVATDVQSKNAVENRDRNSDIAPDRYPNSHPDNHTDRGNMKT